MEKTIYKYELKSIGKQEIQMPKGAVILCIQTQFEDACIWAEVNPSERDFEDRTFEIFGTGHPIHCDMGVERKYIGTFQMSAGNYVFHAYERIN